MKQECRILVVDDDLSFRKLVEKEFKPLGFTIHLAEDGEKALAALESFRPQDSRSAGGYGRHRGSNRSTS